MGAGVDNVLLEWMVALELNARGQLQVTVLRMRSIVPVNVLRTRAIGECTENRVAGGHSVDRRLREQR